jgi:hypothetical protein
LTQGNQPRINTEEHGWGMILPPRERIFQAVMRIISTVDSLLGFAE